jgi:hypothetical protein
MIAALSTQSPYPEPLCERGRRSLPEERYERLPDPARQRIRTMGALGPNSPNLTAHAI